MRKLVDLPQKPQLCFCGKSCIVREECIDTNRKVCGMKTLKKQIPYILLGATLLLLLGLNIISQDHWLDSDMAAEMIFSRILSEEHHIFSTTNWYYSTEFRVLYTQLIMGPLFRICNNWHVIRTITNLVFYGLMLASHYYFASAFFRDHDDTHADGQYLHVPCDPGAVVLRYVSAVVQRRILRKT